MDSFWQNYNMFHLIGLALFPRLALLFFNFQANILFWFGWLFLPRITIAILATIFYFSTNPLLVILSWLIAFSGESAEKKYSYRYTKKRIKNTDYEIVDE